ncbi:hypothetical protein [Streptomyces sp. NPDC002553]|uniref:hypothetical protein n=1 Tax=Streptomyces sp. NPDC002553 TaxID=3154417 RepID=UPI003323CDA4
MSLRLFALGGAVVCAIVLPLAMASAGSVDDEGEFAVSPLPLADDPVTDGRAGGGAVGAAGGGRSGVAGAHGTRDAHSTDDARPPVVTPSASPRLLGLGLATGARCGPELSSPEGVEAQTCVLTQGEDTWARTYYRNSTGRALNAVLSFMGPHGRTVQMRCAVGADDEPGACETPRERAQGDAGAYTAVAEFSGATGATGAADGAGAGGSTAGSAGAGGAASAGAAGSAGGGPLLLRSGSNSEASTGS